jgi:hypothetical protein
MEAAMAMASAADVKEIAGLLRGQQVCFINALKARYQQRLS